MNFGGLTVGGVDLGTVTLAGLNVGGVSFGGADLANPLTPNVASSGAATNLAGPDRDALDRLPEAVSPRVLEELRARLAEAATWHEPTQMQLSAVRDAVTDAVTAVQTDQQTITAALEANAQARTGLLEQTAVAVKQREPTNIRTASRNTGWGRDVT